MGRKCPADCAILLTNRKVPRILLAMSELQLPNGLCGQGRKLKADLAQHTQAITQAQRSIAQCHRAQDSLDRQVPRALHENLSNHLHHRAMGQMQWSRHAAQCDSCRVSEDFLQNVA